MAKVQAVACDRTGCESVARAGDNGVPTSWLVASVTQSGRKVLDGVFCSYTCVVSYLRDTGEPARRRRRTKAEMEADAAEAAAAANGEGAVTEEPAAV
jgi:hypothetical protein